MKKKAPKDHPVLSHFPESTIPIDVREVLRALGVFEKDVDNSQIYSNHMWTSLGITEENMQNNTWEDFIHPDDLAYVKQKITDFEAGKAPYKNCEFRIKDIKSGSWKWIMSSAIPHAAYDDGSISHYFGIDVDISQRKEAEELAHRAWAEAERSRQQLDALRKAAKMINSTLDVDEAIERVLSELRRLMKAEFFSVHVFEDGRVKLEGAIGFEVINYNWVEIDSLSPLHPARIMYQEKRPLLFADFQNKHDAPTGSVLHRVGSWIGVPMVAKNEFIGFLSVASQKVRGVNETDLQLCEMFADQVAIALANAMEYKEVRSLAKYDQLTGLANRAWVLDIAEAHVKAALRNQTELSCIMLDIDYFKKINDSFGHQAGDTILKVIADRIKKSVRDVDLAGRYGGEEFLIILPHTSSKTALVVAERIRSAVEASAIHPADIVTVSLGVSSIQAGEDLSELIKRADTALYRAKSLGRNCVCNE
jgi:diguanylate cyclase (GGDEF)-like protein/PAS domain S-box-containing protein